MAFALSWGKIYWARVFLPKEQQENAVPLLQPCGDGRQALYHRDGCDLSVPTCSGEGGLGTHRHISP